MVKEVLREIITRVKKSKYYSVSVDSSPDEAHQLTIILRLLEDINPTKRFLTFIPNCGHIGNDMAETLIQFLKPHDININDYRGQSYDKAANMSGKYNGMQAKIKNQNGFADFISCCGHSLNLVRKSATNSCLAAVQFF